MTRSPSSYDRRLPLLRDPSPAWASTHRRSQASSGPSRLGSILGFPCNFCHLRDMYIRTGLTTYRGSSATRLSLLKRSLGSLSTRGSTCNSDVHASTATGSPDPDAHGAMTAPGRSARDGTVAPSSTVSAGCAAPGVGPSGYAVWSTPRGVLPAWAVAHGIRPPPS